MAVSGKALSDSAPKLITLNGTKYRVIRTDSNKENRFRFGNKGEDNYKHAEQKLMNYMAKHHARKHARITIAIENTSESQPGRCQGCAPASEKFANYHTNFSVEIYEGSNTENPL